MTPAVVDIDAPQGWPLELYTRMLANFYVEERMKIFVRQGKYSFHASSRGHQVYTALEAARQLESQLDSIDVVDLRSIVPLDEQTIYNRVRKTSRVVVAHEDSLSMGFGAGIAARIRQHCPDSLDTPVTRVPVKDSFVPAAPNLEQMVLPVEDVRRTT